MTWQGEEFQIRLTRGMVRELIIGKWLLLDTEMMCTSKTDVSGGKSVKKAITKVAQGTSKTEGKVWYTELSDKGKQA